MDFDGHLARPGSINQPDGPLLFADHWIPNTAISMDDLPGSSEVIKDMHERSPSKLGALYRDVANMYTQVMARNGAVSVLAHPFDTFLRATNFDGALIDVFEPVCEACQHHGVAVELNEKCLERYYKIYAKVSPLHDDCLPPGDFYDALLRVASRFDLRFSAGSDAHSVRDVGCIDRVRSHIASLGINNERMFRFEPGASRGRFQR